MPRDVKIRTSYQADLAYLGRLARAIEIDPKLSPKVKESLVTKINDLSVAIISDVRSK